MYIRIVAEYGEFRASVDNYIYWKNIYGYAKFYRIIKGYIKSLGGVIVATWGDGYSFHLKGGWQ